VIGAAGNIAADRTARAAPDGYTIGVLAAANIVINVSLYNRLSYDPVKNFAAVTQMYGFPNLFLVNNDVPAKNVAELVALARTQPGRLTYAHNGVGTSTHLSAYATDTVYPRELMAQYVARSQARNLEPLGSSYGVGEPRFKAFGERPRQSPTLGGQFYTDSGRPMGAHLTLIEPSSQADRAFNPTYWPEPIWVSVTPHRNTSGERKPHGITCNAEG